MGFSTFHCTIAEYNTECLCICSGLYSNMNLWRLADFIVQFKNDYVKLGSIVECFLHLHSYWYQSREEQKCVEFNSHVKWRKCFRLIWEKRRKKRESNRIKLVSFFSVFIPFYLRVFFVSHLCACTYAYLLFKSFNQFDEWRLSSHNKNARARVMERHGGEQKREREGKEKEQKKRILMMIFYVFVST